MNTLARVLLVLSLVSLCSYMYGIWETLLSTEENGCKMTYMFEFPQFVKIHFEKNDNYPKYKLYAYAEGRLTEKARNREFDGAPVLFIPGNGGSFRQARSFASVALRMGLDESWIQHLDYYTIDYNEELTGLFGGTLQLQTEFASHCVEAILNLYKHLENRPRTLVVIGHSMGGKIAQAILSNVSEHITTIITLAAPLDKPVLNFDSHTHMFYNKVEKQWNKKRGVMRVITNDTNFCGQSYDRSISKTTEDDRFELNNKLMISIGGGSRDILVHSGLTESRYSDIHAMTTSINNVWVSTDHLSAVWCLQLVIVVNKFLFSSIEPKNSKKRQGQQFIEDKSTLLGKAHHYFNNVPYSRNEHLVNLINNDKDIGDWIEDSRRVFSEKFQSGIDRTRIQMIRLHSNDLHKFLKVEVVNVKTHDWVFGCNAKEINNMARYCAQAISLTHYAKKQPSLSQLRQIITVDLHDLKKKHPEWTHVIIRILPTKEPFKLYVDVHNPSDRELKVTMPAWYSTTKIQLLQETLIGSSYYNLKVSDMEETHQAIELIVRPRSCSTYEHQSVAKVCVPWTNGFDRYHFFTENKSQPLQIYTPIRQPAGYNGTSHKINVELHLDPNCRYEISVKNSITTSMARIVQQYSIWLPAHLVTILLLGFRYQISLTPSDKPFKCDGLRTSLIKGSPFFIISASRFFVKFILFFKNLPQPESYDYPILVSIVIHGSAIALLSITTAGLWTGICFGGNAAHTILLKLINWRIPTLSSVVVYIIKKFPTIAGGILLSIAMASCGGVALICACLVYFIILTNMYEEYLESFIFDTAKMIATKLFGRKESVAHIKPDEPTIEDTTKEEDNENKEIEQTPALTEEESKANAELDTLLQESVAQKDKKKLQEEALRAEYDAIPEGLSAINFHLTLFMFLILLTLLNIPSVITWAKNYSYSQILRPDPGQLVSLIVIGCLCVLWQVPTPRKLMGYKAISAVLYIDAVLSLLYCQDSIYRLNYVIAGVFIIITLHQMLAPKEKLKLVIDDIKLKIEQDKSKNLNLKND